MFDFLKKVCTSENTALKVVRKFDKVTYEITLINNRKISIDLQDYSVDHHNGVSCVEFFISAERQLVDVVKSGVWVDKEFFSAVGILSAKEINRLELENK